MILVFYILLVNLLQWQNYKMHTDYYYKYDYYKVI